jgi:3-methyladenine DNA glycosylase/8-oxoguanine DNA glycosylase
MRDEDVIEALVQVKGIGSDSTNVLIFSLGCLDVFRMTILGCAWRFGICTG